jgi:peptidoglycan/LPS O-acetylase OafA/YrhL
MSMRMTTPDADARLIGLEVLRFLAAIAVLVWHYQHFMFIGHVGTPWDPARLPFHWLLAPFYTYGYQGVELFWCISGFIFTWKYGERISEASLSFGRFVWLRFSRLYPLHLATLLIVAGLQVVYSDWYGQTFVYIYNDARHFVLSLLFANWWGFQLGESFNGPSWSVSAEVLIYIAFFWVCRMAGSGWKTCLVTMAAFGAGAGVVQTLFGIKLSFTGAGTFFFLGASVLHLYRWIETHRRRQQNLFAWGCAVVILVVSGLVYRRTLAIAGGGLAIFPASILLTQLVIRPSSAKVAAGLTTLGNLTYASYMTHFPMQLGAMLVFGPALVRSWIYQDWFMLAYLGSVLAVAFVVFRWVERPAQDGLRALGRRR